MCSMFRADASSGLASPRSSLPRQRSSPPLSLLRRCRRRRRGRRLERGGAGALGHADQPDLAGVDRGDGAVRGGQRLQHAARAGARPRRCLLREPRSSRAPTALAASRPRFDPLATTIAAAHERGLRVHAWVNVNLVSSATELPTRATHIVYAASRLADGAADARVRAVAHRSARARSTSAGLRAGRARCPTRSRASTRRPSIRRRSIISAAVVDDLVSRYALDGIHLDYVRYPVGGLRLQPRVAGGVPQAGRPRADARRSALRYGVSRHGGPRGPAPTRSRSDGPSFRRSRLNTLVMRLRTVVKTRRPRAHVERRGLSRPRGGGGAGCRTGGCGSTTADRRGVPDGVHA